eukprot:442641-Amphidinium_carterae.2
MEENFQGLDVFPRQGAEFSDTPLISPHTFTWFNALEDLPRVALRRAEPLEQHSNSIELNNKNM